MRIPTDFTSVIIFLVLTFSSLLDIFLFFEEEENSM